MADIGEVNIPCPDCGTTLTIGMQVSHAEPRADGTLMVDVKADELEIELHAMVCTKA